MTMRLGLKFFAVMLIACVMAPDRALAQESSDVDSAQQQQAGAQERDDESANASADESANEAADESANEQADTQRPDLDSQPLETPAGQTPGRFIPSEQISLDLGVSFPVDI